MDLGPAALDGCARPKAIESGSAKLIDADDAGFQQTLEVLAESGDACLQMVGQLRDLHRLCCQYDQDPLPQPIGHEGAELADRRHGIGARSRPRVAMRLGAGRPGSTQTPPGDTIV
jgi:hypothetical protein